MSNPARIALVTPVRDEGKYIAAMIESIIDQCVRPKKWIIVDDGSTDTTCDIVRAYARKNSFISLIQLPPRTERRPGGENAIAHALRCINLDDFEFIARFDADLRFDCDYLARILDEFAADPSLGIAGGGLYIMQGGELRLERAPSYHVRGALKMYRRECYKAIGGLTTQIGWDTIDEVTAWTKGWKTVSFCNFQVLHCRPTGQGLRAHRVYWERGKADYATWSHPLFVAAKALKLTVKAAGPASAACFLAGFLWCYVMRRGRLIDQKFTKTRRRQQWERAKAGIAARLARLMGSRSDTNVPRLGIRDGR